MLKVMSANDLHFLKLQQDLVKSSIPSGGGSPPKNPSATEFLDLMEKGIKEINTGAREAEKASMDLASGRTSNIHETMLAVTKAELGFDMMVQMRNKVIEAYQEVMRMQV